jgi:plastocyanin
MAFDRSRLVLRLLALIAGFGLLLAACGDDSDSGSDSGGGDESTESADGGGDCDTDVCMEGIAFTELEVTVSTGDTVTWTNLDGVDHTVTAGSADAPAPDDFDSGNIAGGDSFDLNFDAAGEFAYYCTIHPQMEATILVE